MIHLLSLVFFAVMKLNRIRNLEAIWKSDAAPHITAPAGIPEGFEAMSLSHLPLEQQQKIANQRELYLWAFQESKRRVEEEFFGDFMI